MTSIEKQVHLQAINLFFSAVKSQLTVAITDFRCNIAANIFESFDFTF